MHGKEARTLRSDFLIHWTGRDINRNYKTLTLSQREEYINRLHDTLLPDDPLDPKTNGLWMTEREEVIFREKGVKQKLRYQIPKTCFTEVKLSLTRQHTERYGCLGFGFSRTFILERDGAPVFYVDPGTERGGILQHFIRQFVTIEALHYALSMEEVKNSLQKSGIIPMLKDHLLSRVRSHQYAPLLKPTVAQRIEKNLQEYLDKKEFEKIFFSLLNSVANNMLFLKPMSDCQDPRDYEFLDEGEWRVVMPVRLRADPSHPYIHYIGKDKEPEAKIWFKQSDLKVLILPDDETRRQALDEETVLSKGIVEWLFNDPANVPIIATVGECLQF